MDFVLNVIADTQKYLYHARQPKTNNYNRPRNTKATIKNYQFIYIAIHTYIHIYTSIHIHINIHIHTNKPHTHTHIWLNMHTHIYINIHINTQAKQTNIQMYSVFVCIFHLFIVYNTEVNFKLIIGPTSGWLI